VIKTREREYSMNGVRRETAEKQRKKQQQREREKQLKKNNEVFSNFTPD